MEAIHRARGYTHQSWDRGAAASFVSAASQLIAAAIVAVIVTLGIVHGMPTTATGTTTIEAEQRPLAKEWVWKKEPVRFDHMWRVPY